MSSSSNNPNSSEDFAYELLTDDDETATESPRTKYFKKMFNAVQLSTALFKDEIAQADTSSENSVLEEPHHVPGNQTFIGQDRGPLTDVDPNEKTLVPPPRLGRPRSKHYEVRSVDESTGRAPANRRETNPPRKRGRPRGLPRGRPPVKQQKKKRGRKSADLPIPDNPFTPHKLIDPDLESPENLQKSAYPRTRSKSIIFDQPKFNDPIPTPHSSAAALRAKAGRLGRKKSVTFTASESHESNKVYPTTPIPSVCSMPANEPKLTGLRTPTIARSPVTCSSQLSPSSNLAISRVTQSTIGCWTCRLRRKKCDQAAPMCKTCQKLGIHCDYNTKRPLYMTDSKLNAAKRRELVAMVRAQRVLAHHP